jgi:hypothetical protein
VSDQGTRVSAHPDVRLPGSHLRRTTTLGAPRDQVILTGVDERTARTIGSFLLAMQAGLAAQMASRSGACGLGRRYGRGSEEGFRNRGVGRALSGTDPSRGQVDSRFLRRYSRTPEGRETTVHAPLFDVLADGEWYSEDHGGMHALPE